ncbi:transporter substrate-binding domain-containing protein [Pseudomonas chlororaphis]|uniref:transporter substrate-binding domain-containing protein n=1 Tax=Pseudomonas chlororaphis TaxID=587753 RepID=UPI00209B2F31|nr:transporter substrate-binding domain-containing protein [Pseudomonas chlororaphis]MCO7612755.1 transporter substrate-binding domain-containing protein [Pseudomonas chlororaphis]
MSALTSAQSPVINNLNLGSRLTLEPTEIVLSEDDWHWLRQKHRLVLGVSASSFPPLDTIFNSQEYEGITADVVTLIAQLLNVEVQVLALPDRASALAALESGQIDLLSSSNSFERDSPFVALSKPYVKDRPALFRRQGDTRTFADDLSGLRVATPADYLQLPELQARFPAAKFVPMKSHMESMAALAFGPADLYLGDNLSTFSMINRNFFNDIRLERFLDVDTGGFGFAIHQENQRLLRIINTVIDRLGEDRLLAIVKRWSGGDVALTDRKLALTPQENRWIQRHPVVRLVINDDLAPIAYYNTDGNFNGIVADLLSMISLRSGLQFEVQRKGSFPSIMEALKNKEADLAILTASADRETFLRFSRPFGSTSFALVTKVRSENDTTDLASLQGKRLAIAEGHVLFDKIKKDFPQIQMVSASTTLDAMSLVNDNKADAAIVSLSIGRYYIGRLYDQKLKVANIIDNGQATGNFAMRRSDTELQSILDKALLSIPPDELIAVSNRWRANAAMSGQTWRDYRGVIASVVAGSLLVLLMALGWIFHLRRQIGKRVAAEQALVDQLALMQALSNGMPHPVYMRDRDGYMLSCNDSYLEAVGLTRTQVLGKTAEQVFDTNCNLLPDFHKGYLKAMDEDRVITQSCALKLHGNVRWIDHWTQPFHDASGNVKGVICGWLDITEHRRLVAELEAAKNMADEASRTKTTFLASMSHEIRTPMNAVIGILELVLKRGERGTFDQAGIEIAYSSAKSLLGLIGDILDIARIESGRLSLSPKRANLRELMESVALVFEGLSRQKGLDLKLDIDSSTNCDVLVDPLRFKQVLSNLLSNAIKFTDEGSVKVQIRGETMEPGRLNVHLLIEDSGIGISSEDQQKLFKPFAQTTQGVRKGQDGAGLGLLISRSLCELMGGRLTMTSARGQGTQVRVDLLLNILEPVESYQLDGVKALPDVARSLKVLVVDDHAMNREILRQQMHFLGHEVVEADNGSVALDKWRKGGFDVVLTDCHMPLMSGPELAKAIRQEEREHQQGACVILGLTADAQPEEIERSIQAGMNDCLIKPIGLDALAERITSIDRMLRRNLDDTPGIRADSAEPFDQNVLYDLAPLTELTGGDPGLMAHLIDELLVSNRKDLEDLIQLVEDQDSAGLSELGHRIKGAARVVTANRLIHCCDQLERVCSQPGLPYATLMDASDAVEQAIFELEQALSQLPKE